MWRLDKITQISNALDAESSLRENRTICIYKYIKQTNYPHTLLTQCHVLYVVEISLQFVPASTFIAPSDFDKKLNKLVVSRVINGLVVAKFCTKPSCT